MGDSDVFGKLSRIFETHGFANDDAALSEILEDFDPSLIDAAEIGGRNDQRLHDYSSTTLHQTRNQESPSRSTAIGFSAEESPIGSRRTPYEVWRQKNKEKFAKKKTYPKLNGQQWDRLVEKMHHANRIKQSSMIQEQNHGLAAELEGYSFQPRINRTSQELSATMKSLTLRVPEMLAEREKNIESKRKESEQQEMAECSFTPKRFGAKTSDYYLKRMGREKSTPGDFYKFEEEKERRNEVRKQILTEMEERELTFKPQLSEKSIKLQERMIQKGMIDIDPTTRTAIASGPKLLSTATGTNATAATTSVEDYEEGPVLQVESEHPYRHNTNEFTTVQIPNAVRYSITFHEQTKTEAIYDFVKFYDDETHTEHFGAGKYSGGKGGSPCNWPGIGNRPPLIIPASKFIVHFRTNGTVNDWGFRMLIVPLLCVRPDWRMQQRLLAEKEAGAFTPTISDAARSYQRPRQNDEAAGGTGDDYHPQPAQVHERLYRDAVERKTEFHNSQVDLLQNKLNVSLKPWENLRSASEPGGRGHSLIKVNQNTHLPKSSVVDVAESMIVDPEALLTGSGTIATRGQLGGTGASGTASQLLSTLAMEKGPAFLTAVVEFDDSMSILWRQLRTI